MIAAWLGVVLAQDPTPLRAAERAFHAGDVDTAMRHYQQALADPAIAPAPVLANLGRCALRLQRPAEAICSSGARCCGNPAMRPSSTTCSWPRWPAACRPTRKRGRWPGNG